MVVAMRKSPYALLPDINTCSPGGDCHFHMAFNHEGHFPDQHVSANSPITKKIAVTVPRGQSDDGDHGNMTGVDG